MISVRSLSLAHAALVALLAAAPIVACAPAPAQPAADAGNGRKKVATKEDKEDEETDEDEDNDEEQRARPDAGAAPMCSLGTLTKKEACDVCLKESCCDVARACESKSACKTLAGCVSDCNGDADCTKECGFSSPGGLVKFPAVVECAAKSCAIDCTLG